MRPMQRKHSSGFVIVLALIAIMAMSFFLLTGAATTTSTMKVAGNYAKTVDVFNIAEVGVAKARVLLEGNAFDDLLVDNYGSFFISPTDFNEGTYEVTLFDNDDGDGNPLADADGIIIINSVGRSNIGGKVEIETHVQLINSANPIAFPDNPPGGDSAGLLCGAGSDITRQGSAEIDGANYDAPVLPCTGSGCNTDPDPTTTGNLDIIAEGAVTCTGCSGLNVQQSAGAAANCDQWETLYNQLASLSGNAPGVEVLSGTSATGLLSDCDNPKVFIINTSADTFRLTGNTGICGTVVIASNTTLEMSGTITIIGLVLMMGPNSNVTYAGTSGTSNLIGKFVFNSAAVDAEKELYVKGNADVHYSSAGLGYALDAINNSGAGGGACGGGTLLTVAWEEKY